MKRKDNKFLFITASDSRVNPPWQSTDECGSQNPPSTCVACANGCIRQQRIQILLIGLRKTIFIEDDPLAII